MELLWCKPASEGELAVRLRWKEVESLNDCGVSAKGRVELGFAGGQELYANQQPLKVEPSRDAHPACAQLDVFALMSSMQLAELFSEEREGAPDGLKIRLGASKHGAGTEIRLSPQGPGGIDVLIADFVDAKRRPPLPGAAKPTPVAPMIVTGHASKIVSAFFEEGATLADVAFLVVISKKPAQELKGSCGPYATTRQGPDKSFPITFAPTTQSSIVPTRAKSWPRRASSRRLHTTRGPAPTESRAPFRTKPSAAGCSRTVPLSNRARRRSREQVGCLLRLSGPPHVIQATKAAARGSTRGTASTA